jgi:OOP family OmpA-OmpF porin
MQEWKRAGAAAAALAFSVAAFAQASAPSDSIAANIYVGAGGGQAQWRPGCPGTQPTCDDTNPSVHVFAGYQVNRRLAGEVAFTNYGKATGPSVEVKGRGWEASLVAGWPLVGPVSVLGRLGAYRGVLKGGGQFAGKTESNYGVTYGVGAQMDFTPNVGARLEWQAFPGAGGSTITDNDIKIVSVSALWRFR